MGLWREPLRAKADGSMTMRLGGPTGTGASQAVYGYGNCPEWGGGENYYEPRR